MNTCRTLLSFGLALAVSSYAAQYEAESATLSGTAQTASDGGASGSSYVQMQSGNITFTNIQASSAGKYNLKIRYKAGDYKENDISVNSASAGTVSFAATSSWSEVSTVISLKAGTNTIAIVKSWGWIDVDYIDVSAYESVAFNISADPVTPNATDGAKKIYSFLRENFGKKTISGIMTGSMDGYTKGADFRTHEDPKNVYTRSGKYPALVGVDFLFATGPNASGSWQTEYTEKGLSLAKDLWSRGGIPAFTWHWKDPLDQKDAFYIQSAAGSNEYTDFDYSTAFKSGTTEWDTNSEAYKGIIADIDHIADYFLELQTAGVAAIFRPLHEAGGKWFWWSINSGAQFAALYRLVYDRMVNVKGVKNLIWVFNPESGTVYDWDPGSEYYDIISIDIYNTDNDYSSNSAAFEKFKAATNNKKMVALTENGPLPDVNNMHSDEAVWSWWMVWYGSWNGKWPGQTSNDVWKNNMEDNRIITFEDMPGWGSFTPAIESSSSEPVAESSSSVEHTLRLVKDLELNGSSKITGIFDLNGHYMGSEGAMSKLPQGRYIVRSQKAGHTVNTLYIKK
ncbi:glycosyl hydrolase [Fibrobacter sp. UWEL]|uniref:glycosyl hydrolase n=1 Tax=Fibrobacter sp. UWEL TaxID=1896209 RepID=UPI00091A6AD1|nr:glycosyl hydrolase [Fibrobacter sp. UWEL]SHK50040.1 Carbohydrate binding module (family 35) [Fibrobacter sp. UWEL]